MRRITPDLSRAYLMFLCLLLGGAVMAGSEGLVNQKAKVKNFRLPQFNSDGTRDWFLRAKEGVSSGKSYLLKTVHMILYRSKEAGGNIHIRTPECTFSREKQLGRSNRPVNIRSDNLIIDGVGFDLDCRSGKRSILIRSRVRLKIFKSDGAILGSKGK